MLQREKQKWRGRDGERGKEETQFPVAMRRGWVSLIHVKIVLMMASPEGHQRIEHKEKRIGKEPECHEETVDIRRMKKQKDKSEFFRELHFELTRHQRSSYQSKKTVCLYEKDIKSSNRITRNNQ